MNHESAVTPISKGMLWTGRVMSWLPALMLLMSGVMGIAPPDSMREETAKSGFPVSAMMPLGVITIASVLLYLYPRTAVLGAILLTGYLGGAVCLHVFNGDPLGQMLFPVLFGAVLWGGLVVRDARLRSLLPWRSGTLHS